MIENPTEATMPQTPLSRLLTRDFATAKRSGLALTADTDDYTTFMAAVTSFDIVRCSELWVSAKSSVASQTCKVRLLLTDEADAIIGLSDELTLITGTVLDAGGGKYLSEMKPLDTYGASKGRVYYTSAIASGTVNVHVALRR